MFRYATYRVSMPLVLAAMLSGCGHEGEPERPGDSESIEQGSLEFDEDDPNLAPAVVEAFLGRQGYEPPDEPDTAPDRDLPEGVSSLTQAVVERRTVYGYVTDNAGQPVAGIRVTAFDGDPGTDPQMARGFTNSRGYYELHYEKKKWDRLCPDWMSCRLPDIYVTLSVRKWKSCTHYGWDRTFTSSTRSNWRMRDPLPINMRSRPLSEIQHSYADRPACPAPKPKPKPRKGTYYTVKNCNPGIPIRVSWNGGTPVTVSCRRSSYSHFVPAGQTHRLSTWSASCNYHGSACCVSPVGWRGPADRQLSGSSSGLNYVTVPIGAGCTSSATIIPLLPKAAF